MLILPYSAQCSVNFVFKLLSINYISPVVFFMRFFYSLTDFASDPFDFSSSKTDKQVAP